MITVTENAAKKMREFIEQQGKPNLGIRVRVVGGGCSGLQYQVNFEERSMPGDKIFAFDGVRVFIDMKSGLFLKGVEMDYDEGLSGKGFRFKNPSAKSSCGCGESFS